MRVLTNFFGWFTLEVPEGWQSQADDSVTVLTGADRHGTIYISGGRHAGGKQRDFGGADFLQRFLASVNVSVELGEIRSAAAAGCRIYSHVRDTQAEHWRYYSITDDETALLVTYACKAEHAGKEDAEIEEMVQSVKLYRSAAN